MKLYELKNEYLELSQMLADDENQIPEEALRDTLEGIAGEIEDKVLNIAAVIESFKAHADAIKKARDKMYKREQTLQAATQRLKDYVIFCMRATGVKKAESPELRVTLSDGVARVVIDNEDSLPADFVALRTEKFIDKRQIMEAIKEGQEVPGVHLEKTPSLRIS
jgi:exonuclease VII small subunit